MKDLKIAFFTEAGTSRGLGHLIRCHTISDKFKSLSINTSFFLDSDLDFSYKFDDIEYFKWDKFKLDNHYDIIFIDSYEAQLGIYDTISKSCIVAVYIDDYKRLTYPKGVIINFSPDANKILYEQKESTHSYLLGLKYVPIRDEFLNLLTTKSEQLFLMLGGSDTAHLSETICKHLKDINIKIVVVINDQNSAARLSEYENIKVLFKPSDKELITEMAKSSVAISTASMALYEFSYLHIPTIVIAVSNNQKLGAITLVKHKIVSKYISIEEDNWLNDLKINIQKPQSMDYPIDAKGAQRVVDEILRMLK